VCGAQGVAVCFMRFFKSIITVQIVNVFFSFVYLTESSLFEPLKKIWHENSRIFLLGNIDCKFVCVSDAMLAVYNPFKTQWLEFRD